MIIKLHMSARKEYTQYHLQALHYFVFLYYLWHCVLLYMNSLLNQLKVFLNIKIFSLEL